MESIDLTTKTINLHKHRPTYLCFRYFTYFVLLKFLFSFYLIRFWFCFLLSSFMAIYSTSNFYVAYHFCISLRAPSSLLSLSPTSLTSLNTIRHLTPHNLFTFFTFFATSQFPVCISVLVVAVVPEGAQRAKCCQTLVIWGSKGRSPCYTVYSKYHTTRWHKDKLDL